ncbi:hypothetical protein A4G29_20285 [Mycobacterium kansasii]|nr:hypothetical protein A4G29_20285 [Mycobacterium kansasii]
MSVEPDNTDVESLGLLDHLDGRARKERAELITWLLDRGFDVDQIRDAFIPMLLPANRAIGDDGTTVSAREISESSGVSLDLLQRLHRAAGLVRVYDPDSPLRSRADAEAVLNAARLVDLGLDPARVGLVVRLLVEGLTGPAVALASRVTHAAPSGAVWLTEAARAAMGDAPGLEWSFVGARHLRGIHGEVRLYAVRRTTSG